MKYPKLPKSFKTRWVKALRSGKYKQGRYYLFTSYDEEQYCCLGVACKVQKATLPQEELRFIEFRKGIKGITKIPKELIGDGPLPERLSMMNDRKSSSFKKIADWIEKHL